ncbi:hypothetical protein HMP0015_1224 [Acinetobacter haemolyticus ATCC 19194]|uniref:Uncharacterized protein n=3 Tax=Acinetobacter haemolyticus TaxID=29430 RepID=D4XND2_ACIHA|nr:hypothetical protein HMP0015_1224 [Acinetobacter haemolyticus ATCC 19194]
MSEVIMMVPMILFPVVAFGLAIGIGRVGTIVKDAMRVDFTTEMDDSHELKSESQKGSAA